MRAEIIALGGDVRFESKVTDVLIKTAIEGVPLASGEQCAPACGAGTGHSSRDTPRMLNGAGYSSRPSHSRLPF
jgi:uncharacterized FAD-dependent dehydrogenase